MKKYKLIKEYPGSPELGTSIDMVTPDTYFTYHNSKPIQLKDYPEYWEEVVEKDYEILTITPSDKNTICKPSQEIRKYKGTNTYIVSIQKQLKYSKTYMFINGKKLKRLSDKQYSTYKTI